MIFFKPKYQLVSDGKNYAIKNRSNDTYFDFERLYFWWAKDDDYFRRCWISDRELAEMWLARFLS